MSIHNNINKAQLESFRETINAIELLLGISNSISIKKDKSYSQYRYGYPASVLIFSFIEAFGNIVLNEEKEKAYKILKSDYFENQKLNDEQIKSLYNKYRSPLIHNLLTIPNSFLVFNRDDQKSFYSNDDCKDIISINVYSLYCLCRNAFNKINDQSESSYPNKSIENIIKKSLKSNNIPICTTNPSGNTKTDS